MDIDIYCNNLITILCVDPKKIMKLLRKLDVENIQKYMRVLTLLITKEL